MPRRKAVEQPIAIELPTLTSPKDAVTASASLLAAVAGGEVAPGEAREIGRLMELHLKAVELHDFETRLAALEASRHDRAPIERRLGAWSRREPRPVGPVLLMANSDAEADREIERLRAEYPDGMPEPLFVMILAEPEIGGEGDEHQLAPSA